MLFKPTTILVASLLGTTFASPVAKTENAGSLAPRDGDPKPPPPDSACMLLNDFTFAYQWALYVPLKNKGGDGRGTINPDTGECAGGVLDNMRGICGAISDWTCFAVNAEGKQIDGHDKSAVGAAMKFATSNFCTLDNVSGALQAATGTKTTCSRGSPPIMFPGVAVVPQGGE